MDRMGIGSVTVRLTNALVAAITEAHRLGAPQPQAAALAGVSDRTLRRRLAAGESELERLDGDPTAKPDRAKAQYVRLVRSIKDGDARHVREALSVIRNAALGGAARKRTTTRHPDGSETVVETLSEGQWTAAAWLLERRHVRDFGRRTFSEVTGSEGGPIHVDPPIEQRIAEKLQAYLKGVADSGSLTVAPIDQTDGA